MIKTLSNIVSAIFHPLLWPVYSCIIILYLIPTWESVSLTNEIKRAIILIVAIFTFVLPSATIILLKVQKIISSYQLSEKQERKWPYLLTLLFNAGLLGLFSQLNLPLLISKILWVSTLSIALTFIMNLKIKLSAHMVAVSAILASFWSLNFLQIAFIPNLILLMIYITALVASARIYLKAHTPKEIIIGSLVGFITGLGIFLS